MTTGWSIYFFHTCVGSSFLNFSGELVQNCTQNSLRKNILSQILEKIATFDNTPKKSLLSKSGYKILWVNNNKIW
jgi:hypothetical protein